MLENLHLLKGGENVQQPMITVKRIGHPEQIIMNDVSLCIADPLCSMVQVFTMPNKQPTKQFRKSSQARSKFHPAKSTPNEPETKLHR